MHRDCLSRAKWSTEDDCEEDTAEKKQAAKARLSVNPAAHARRGSCSTGDFIANAVAVYRRDNEMATTGAA